MSLDRCVASCSLGVPGMQPLRTVTLGNTLVTQCVKTETLRMYMGVDVCEKKDCGMWSEVT